MCKTRDLNLMLCQDYDENEYLKMFLSKWPYNHAGRKRNNARNTIKFAFCSDCNNKNPALVRPPSEAVVHNDWDLVSRKHL